uniref:Uncharacterized protein n=1 Tax=Hucho hucho TaxID=62062 RepID=A0A4W5KSH5_9TELE
MVSHGAVLRYALRVSPETTSLSSVTSTGMDTNNRSMDVLVTELNVLLKLLDHETLSFPTEEKKTSVRNLLKQLQPTVTGPDYLYMNTSVYRHGTSFVESLFETFGEFGPWSNTNFI